MATVLNEILDSFYERLSESEAINKATIEELRGLFESGKKLKADDFVAIIENPTNEAQP